MTKSRTNNALMIENTNCMQSEPTVNFFAFSHFCFIAEVMTQRSPEHLPRNAK
jgi:ABC-type anion transport system duplicated permease subunit